MRNASPRHTPTNKRPTAHRIIEAIAKKSQRVPVPPLTHIHNESFHCTSAHPGNALAP